MVIAIKAGNVLGGPSTALENMFNAIPVNLIKQMVRNHILGVVVLASLLVTPGSSNGAFKCPTNLLSIQENNKIFFEEDVIEEGVRKEAITERKFAAKAILRSELVIGQILINVTMNMVLLAFNGTRAN